MTNDPNERRAADRLDAFWDEVVFGQLTGNAPDRAGSPDEDFVMHLQSLFAPSDVGAENRVRHLLFGASPERATSAGPIYALPAPRPEPIRPTWSIRRYSQLAAAALIVVLVGALVAAQSAGIFGSRGGNDTPTAIPAAVAQVD